MLSSVLLIAGCEVDNGGDNGVQTGGVGGAATDSPQRGVELDFSDGNPGSEIYAGENNNFAFIFRNHQEHRIEDLELEIGGFDRGYVSGLSESYSVDEIPAASQAAGEGVYTGLVEEGVVVEGFSGNSYSMNPRYRYCYSASSFHEESICVPDVRNQCDIDVEEEGSANGHLGIDITRINSLDNSVRVEMRITNQGDGQVVNECFETDDFSINYDIEANLGSESGDCSPVGTDDFVLSGGERGTVQCEFSRTSDDSYSSQISVDLDYRYQQEERKNLRVVNLD